MLSLSLIYIDFISLTHIQNKNAEAISRAIEEIAFIRNLKDTGNSATETNLFNQDSEGNSTVKHALRDKENRITETSVIKRDCEANLTNKHAREFQSYHSAWVVKGTVMFNDRRSLQISIGVMPATQSPLQR